MAQIISTGQEKSGHELVRRTWKAYLRGVNFEKKWEVVLHDGVMAGGSLSSANISTKNSSISSALSTQMNKKTASGAIELTFVCSSMHDGRNANNGWLQECLACCQMYACINIFVA